MGRDWSLLRRWIRCFGKLSCHETCRCPFRIECFYEAMTHPDKIAAALKRKGRTWKRL